MPNNFAGIKLTFTLPEEEFPKWRKIKWVKIIITIKIIILNFKFTNGKFPRLCIFVAIIIDKKKFSKHRCLTLKYKDRKFRSLAPVAWPQALSQIQPRYLGLSRQRVHPRFVTHTRVISHDSKFSAAASGVVLIYTKAIYLL